MLIQIWVQILLCWCIKFFMSLTFWSPTDDQRRFWENNLRRELFRVFHAANFEWCVVKRATLTGRPIVRMEGMSTTPPLTPAAEGAAWDFAMQILGVCFKSLSPAFFLGWRSYLVALYEAMSRNEMLATPVGIFPLRFPSYSIIKMHHVLLGRIFIMVASFNARNKKCSFSCKHENTFMGCFSVKKGA